MTRLNSQVFPDCETKIKENINVKSLCRSGQELHYNVMQNIVV